MERFYDYFTTERDDAVIVIAEDTKIILGVVYKNHPGRIIMTPKETYRLVRNLLAAAFAAERDA